MSTPQSLSATHGPGWHIEMMVGVPVGSVLSQATSGGQPGGVVALPPLLAQAWQMYPRPQSESVAQVEGVEAKAALAEPRHPSAIRARRDFVGDMSAFRWAEGCRRMR